MNIEQKAKAYDEALNWMRELYPGLHGATKEDAEHYFPELRESEDEKMMNQLHSWMMEFGGAEEYAERVFQWLKGLLEKQKEQKPADDKAFEEWIDDWWKHNKVNNPDSYDKGDEIKFDEKGFKNFCRGIRNMYSNQQSAEWSEEDERMRNQLVYDVEYHKKEGLISAKRNKATKTLYNEIEKCYDEKIAWLKSLRPQPHWKPSEEPESVAERFARIVRANLSKIDKEVQQEFEHLYYEIAGNKMYGGYND